MTIHYKFDGAIDELTQTRIKKAIEEAFQKGDILPCKCPAVEAWVYETIPPDFQASISCPCDAMRPIFSSTPDSED